MALQDEVDKKSKEIHTDKYSSSIGEIVSMYKEGDIDIHPEFQRFYRWNSSQKSRLIESFLLNFPIPPIFVNQREDGVWDIVDGLQRISTILQFIGIYKDENGNLLEPLCLDETKLLPSLKGKYFNKDDDKENSLTESQQRYIKRTRIDIIILKKESDKDGKYEVFQRLNTGGTSLSDQEVRNCMMVMTNRELYKRLEKMSKEECFRNTLRLNEKMLEERYDMELLVRYICLRSDKLENLKNVSDFSEYLTDRIILLLSDGEFDWCEEERIFKETFSYINQYLYDDAFCRYNIEKGKFEGGFYIGAYEMIAVSIGRHNAAKVPIRDGNLYSAVVALWKEIAEKKISWKGFNASGRLSKTLNLGDSLLYEVQNLG